ncbi:histidine phosphatase family protein [Liquorilactobacillus vini]|uniref:Phosphoglycerate mutase n=2 Tax=Liquorilactobacillus vini TaxID=238015 RepID=A0A0R2C761_9LACO|nr:histidine phosphatase family protein [Liquorilactobacillus vini]KRM83932.1 phosphoglycerate mutase [Liquorilactobacillus vini DSM 20605]
MIELTVHFYLVRHGQTKLNRYHRLQGITDSPLTKKGKAAAVKVGKNLKEINFVAAYASDLDRTYTTAKLILKENNQSNVPIYRDPGLRELSFGRFEEGKNRQVLPEIIRLLGLLNIWRAFYQPHHASRLTDLFQQVDHSSQIESARQLVNRMTQTLRYIGHKYNSRQPESNILVVTHAMILSVFIESLNGKVPRMLLKNVQVCRVDYTGEKFVLKTAVKAQKGSRKS